MQAANTGMLIINSSDVKNIDHENNSIKLNRYNSENEETDSIDDIKFIEPNKLLKPAKCKLKNSKSIDE